MSSRQMLGLKATLHTMYVFKYLDGPYVRGEGKGREWWKLPPGYRSFNAEEFEGVEASVSVLQEGLREHKPKVVIGHSQGAILVAYMMALKGRVDFLDVDVVVLNGLAYPGPLKEEGFKDVRGNERLPKVKVVSGKNDSINPPESCICCVDGMRGAGWDVEVIEHEGGHEFMVDEGVIGRVGGAIRETVEG